MPTFRYQALTDQNQWASGTLAAASRGDCQAQLLARAWLPVRIRRQWRRVNKPLCPTALLELCHGLHEQLESGITVSDALSEIAQSGSRRSLRQLVKQLSAALASGQTLASACQQSGQFPSAFLAILAAGEHTGKLAQCIGEFADYQAWHIALHCETRGNLIYPLISALAVLGSGLFLVLYLVPSLKVLLPPEQLTFASRTLFGLVDTITEHGLALCLGSFLSALILRLACKRIDVLQQIYQQALWRLPIFGAWRLSTALAQYTRLLALTYGQGVPILTALHLAQQSTPQPILRDCLTLVAQRVETGTPLANAFQLSAHRATGITWPPVLIRLLSQAEKTGELARALQQISEQLQAQSQRTQKRLHALLQPATTLFSALFLGWVALASFGPLYAQLGRGY